MSQKVTVQEGAYGTLVEAVAGALTGKDDQLLSVNDVGAAVLFDGTLPAVAVMVGKLSPESEEVQVRWLGKGGTVRVIQHVALDIGAAVQARSANARVEAAAAGGQFLGYKIGPTKGGGVGEVIELLDVVGVAPVPSVVTAPAAALPADGTFAGLNSTAVNPTKADFDALLAQCEILRDSHAALVAKVTAIHAALVEQGSVAIA